MNDLVKRLRMESRNPAGADPDYGKAADRIEQLEAALRDLSDGWPCCDVSKTMREIARKALEGKDD